MHANIDVHSRILIDEFPGDGSKCTSKLQSHCANMIFSEKSRYDRIFQQVAHKVGKSKINYIKRFHNAHALSVSLGKNYSEDQLMHIFLDKFHQGRKYSAQIASNQAELRREKTFTHQKYLSISSLQTDHINPDRRSGCGKNSEREILSRQSAIFVEVPTILQKKIQKDQKVKVKISYGW